MTIFCWIVTVLTVTAWMVYAGAVPADLAVISGLTVAAALPLGTAVVGLWKEWREARHVVDQAKKLEHFYDTGTLRK
jgi:ABC-type protease/lipase transport system fused ATPase/permease subunit